MRAIKKAALLFGIVAALGTASLTAYAATSYSTSAEIVAGLTGRTVQDVTDERAETGKTYATIAKEAGKVEDFQEAMLEMRQGYYSDLVSNGSMTRQDADAAVAVIETHHASCDGTGYDSCLLYGTDHSCYNNQGQSSGTNYGGGYGCGSGGRHNSGYGHRGGHH